MATAVKNSIRTELVKLRLGKAPFIAVLAILADVTF